MRTNHTRSPKKGVKRDVHSQETPQLIPAFSKGRTPNLLLHMQMLYLLSHKRFWSWRFKLGRPNKVWSKPQTKSNQTEILIFGLDYSLNGLVWFFFKNIMVWGLVPISIFSDQTPNCTMTKNHNFFKRIGCYLDFLGYSYFYIEYKLEWCWCYQLITNSYTANTYINLKKK